MSLGKPLLLLFNVLICHRGVPAVCVLHAATGNPTGYRTERRLRGPVQKGVRSRARSTGRELWDCRQAASPCRPSVPDSVRQGKNTKHTGPAGAMCEGGLTLCVAWEPGWLSPLGGERTQSGAVARRRGTCFWLVEAAKESDCWGQQEDSGNRSAFRPSGGRGGDGVDWDPAPLALPLTSSVARATVLLLPASVSSSVPVLCASGENWLQSRACSAWERPLVWDFVE